MRRRLTRVVDDGSNDASSSKIVLEVGSDLELYTRRNRNVVSELEESEKKEGETRLTEVIESLSQRLLRQTSNLLVVVSEPSNGSGVAEEVEISPSAPRTIEAEKLTQDIRSRLRSSLARPFQLPSPSREREPQRG